MFRNTLKNPQRMKTLLLLLTFCLTIMGCTDKEPIINADYDILVGKTFQINLISNPTTGYSWKWINSQTVTTIDSIDFNYVPDTPVLDGSGGKEIWKFKGVNAGIDSLKFEYCRGWEENSSIENKIVIVRVK